MQIPDVTTYESHSKLAFHVQLPKLPIRPTKKLECPENDVFCMTDMLLNTIMEDYRDAITEVASQKNHRDKRFLGLLAAGAAGAVLGGYMVHSVMSQFAKPLYARPEDIGTYINKLRQSVSENQRALFLAETNISKFADDMVRTVRNIQREFLISHRKQERSNLVDLNILKLLNVKIERDWFSLSTLSCTQHTIPEKMIPPPNLIKELRKLEMLLFLDGKQLAIPISNIYEYYKIPIVDCIFSTDKATIVVNIPIKRSDTNWQLFEIIPSKFAFNGQVCELYPQDARYLAVSSQKSVLLDHHNSRHCSMHDHRLCLIPQCTQDSSESLDCAIGMLYNKPVSELSKSCAFRCSTNTQLIVSQVEETLNVTCPNGNEFFRFNKTGAVEVHLRCKCTMVVDGVRSIPAPFFCLPELPHSEYVFRTSPNFWSAIDSAIGSKEQYFHEHSNITIDPTWNANVAVLNLTKPEMSVPPEEFHIANYFDLERSWLLALTFVTLIVVAEVNYILVAFLRL
ncbi:unnamed protein product [Allacma fusca]|uniref:Envelope protein n=1 Tax=Allacma fusca TaxID=39272 RepID=A0A8J2J4G9_9HEXA|nr:unnamed protein product [Allacma fusca]